MMKRLIIPILMFVVFQVVIMMLGRLLRQCYLSQEVDEDEVNAVAVTGGAQEKITTKAFKGGYLRAVMGGVELDLSEAAIETPPATIEAMVVMGGAEIKVPPNWQVKTETRAIIGGVEVTGGRERTSEETTPDLVLTGKVIMGGIGIKSVAAEFPGDASSGSKRKVTKGAA
jgi:predicted membrane protein